MKGGGGVGCSELTRWSELEHERRGLGTGGNAGPVSRMEEVQALHVWHLVVKVTWNVSAVGLRGAGGFQ